MNFMIDLKNLNVSDEWAFFEVQREQIRGGH